MSRAIRIENLWKRYRVGVFGHKTLQADLQRWWSRFRGREDPNESLESQLRGKSLVGDELWALRDVSFEVPEGEVFGIIGRNGAGKSTLLKVITKLTAPTRGRITITGRLASLLEVGTGFHPELTGRENVFLNGAILGMGISEIKKKFDEIVDFSGVETFIDTPVKRYSTGMYVRLAFAVAANLDSDILLVDEVLAVGDLDFTKKCMGKMDTVAKDGRTVVLVSHGMANIAHLCRRALLLEDGRVTKLGSAQEVVDAYVHPAETKLTCHVEWDDLEKAPGNHQVRLISVTVLGPDGKPTDTVTTDDEVSVRIRYWNMEPDAKYILHMCLRPPEAGAYEYTVESLNTPLTIDGKDPWFGRPQPVGLYTAICRIPGGVLNNQDWKVYVGIGTPLPRFPVYPLIQLDDIVMFKVVESGSITQYYPGPFNGPVRLKFRWNTEFIGESPMRTGMETLPTPRRHTG